MTHARIRREVADGVPAVTLNQPEARDAMTGDRAEGATASAETRWPRLGAK